MDVNEQKAAVEALKSMDTMTVGPELIAKALKMSPSVLREHARQARRVQDQRGRCLRGTDPVLPERLPPEDRRADGGRTGEDRQRQAGRDHRTDPGAEHYADGNAGLCEARQKGEYRMIAWWVGALLFFLGDMVGIVSMAICAGSADKRDEQIKTNRQRGNADGSGERSSRE